MAETTASYRGTLQVKFWSPGFQPERALDALDNYLGDHGPTGNEFELQPGGGTWRPARSGATLPDLGDWMRDNGLAVIRWERIAQRNNGRWWGLYVLTIGPEVVH